MLLRTWYSESWRQQSNTPGNARVGPSALAGSQGVEDKVHGTVTGQYDQSDDGNEKEDNMANTADKLERVENPPEPQVT